MIAPVNIPYASPYPPVREGFPYTRLRVVHTNDIHEHWDGFARTVSGFKALSEQGIRQGEDVLRLNAGDIATGPEYPMWELGVRLANMLGLDGTTPGNHELLMNAGHYVTALKRWANFPTLASNVNLSPGSIFRSLFSSGHLNTNARIVQGQQGTYGLIGVATGRKRWRPAEEGGLRVNNFDDTCRDVAKEVAKLQSQGINKIVVVSHLGYKQDQQLAQRVSGVDVIVGGDSHDAVHGLQPGKNLFTSPSGEPVVVLQAGANGKFVGALDVLFDQKGRLAPVSSALYSTQQFQPDAEATSVMNMYLPPEAPVATLINGYDCEARHHQPDPLAQLTADGLRAMTGCDIAIIPSTDIRKSIPAGLLTNRELKTVMPYAGPINCSTISGLELQSVLNNVAKGLNGKERNHVAVLNASGLCYTADPNTGTASNILVWNRSNNRWEAATMDPVPRYRIALDEFLIQNRDNLYPEFGHPERVYNKIDMGGREGLVWALRQMGAPYRPVSIPPADDRLIILPKTPGQAMNVEA